MAAEGAVNLLRLRDFVSPELLSRASPSRNLAVPGVLRTLAGLMVLSLILLGLALYYTPWVQTAAGFGRVTALDPGDRQQSLTVLTDGRIKRWFVQEGSRVKLGDPIVEIEDVDPNFVDRLGAERAALNQKYNAARTASQTAKINYERQERLFEKGLAARSDFETAKIKYKGHLADEAAFLAELNKADINLTQQSTRVVTAPRDGTVVGITAGDTATLVKQGQAVATFIPHDTRRAVELYISGLDAPLVYPGRRLRLQFDGWPAVQFSGWPSVAVGTFAAVVQSVDPAAQPDGRFRVLVVEDPAEPWPAATYVRFGAQVQGWILLNTVRLGYEWWRRLNSFPPLSDAVASHGGYASPESRAP